VTRKKNKLKLLAGGKIEKEIRSLWAGEVAGNSGGGGDSTVTKEGGVRGLRGRI